MPVTRSHGRHETASQNNIFRSKFLEAAYEYGTNSVMQNLLTNTDELRKPAFYKARRSVILHGREQTGAEKKVNTSQT